MKKILALVLALLMVFALFSACAKKEDKADGGKTDAGKTDSGELTTTGTIGVDKDAAHPSDDAVLRFAGMTEPENWQNLAVTYGSKNYALYTGLLYDTLIGWDSTTNSLVPSLATEWEWVEDTVLRLKLRDDVNSINGDPFKASDVIYTIKQGCEEPKLATYFSSVFDLDKCKAVDDYTVDIGIVSVNPFFDLDLAHKAYMINVEASVEAAGGFEATKNDPIAGTGPYKLVDWKEGQCAYFERRDDYWGTLPYYAKLEYYFITDPTTRSMGLEAGDYDIIEKAPASAAEQLGGDPKFTVIKAKNDSVCLLCLNSDKEPLNVLECRQAIALAANYDALIQVAASGDADPCDSIFSNVSLGYVAPDPNNENIMGNYNVELAKKKLVEAGYPDGFEIDCHYRTNESKWVDSVNILIQNLAEVGITFTPVQCESAVWYTDSETGNFDTVIFTQANPNPRRTIQNVDYRWPQNRCGTNWMPEGTEDIIDQCMTELDDAKRMDAFKKLNDLARTNVPQLSLFTPYTTWIMSSDIVNLMTDSFGMIEFESIWTADYLG